MVPRGGSQGAPGTQLVEVMLALGQLRANLSQLGPTWCQLGLSWLQLGPENYPKRGPGTLQEQYKKNQKKHEKLNPWGPGEGQPPWQN